MLTGVFRESNGYTDTTLDRDATKVRIKQPIIAVLVMLAGTGFGVKKLAVATRRLSERSQPTAGHPNS